VKTIFIDYWLRRKGKREKIECNLILFYENKQKFFLKKMIFLKKRLNRIFFFVFFTYIPRKKIEFFSLIF